MAHVPPRTSPDGAARQVIAHLSERESRGFTFSKRSILLSAAAALALGIGGVTAVFSTIDTLLLTPYPLPDPDRLLTLRQNIPNVGSSLPFPPSLYEELRDSARGVDVDAIGAYDRVYFNLSVDREPERVPSAQASSNLFSLLGIEPALGRPFLPKDEIAEGPRVAIISHGLWERRFDGNPDVVGRELEVDTTVLYGPPRPIPERLTVVGVLPAEFRVPWSPVDIWIPLVVDRGEGYQSPYLMIVARLANDLPIKQAEPS